MPIDASTSRSAPGLFDKTFGSTVAYLITAALTILSCMASWAAEKGAQSVDLFEAVVLTPEGLNTSEQKALEMLVEEVAARSLARWTIDTSWPATDVPVVVVSSQQAIASMEGAALIALDTDSLEERSEGYQIRVVNSREAATVVVAGADSRGVLFGCGRLLREMQITRDTVTLPASTLIKTAPALAVRGHQLGYRPKVNSYDGWTPEMWEQYIRDLVVFGVNAIELIPPRSDDRDESPHFPLPKIEMMETMSQLAKDYGLDLWIWYPAMERDYSDPATVTSELNAWGKIFGRLPHISAIFVPGGDPGHTQPKILFELLKRQTENLHAYHPDAEMWMSPQSFTADWTDEFHALMSASPDWLTGIVFGPQNRESLEELRAKLPEKFPIRGYPDITHSLASQFAVPHWDPAYALTENREGINPRPTQFATVCRHWDDLTCGFIAYSEGCNDDVNKAVWSGLGWDPETDVVEILRDYARYFIGPNYEDSFAQGLLALERNWIGPLLTNASVETTWLQFEQMVREASPQVKLNWRFQQALYRANYDAYVQARLLYETALEEQAMVALRQADRLGAELAMRTAQSILERAVTEPQSQDIRARAFEMAEALYQSIRMQLSVPRYQAIAIRRGANLDLIDYPLNDRVWLVGEFATIRSLESEREKLAAISAIVDWDNPGPGGFYDDLGQPEAEPHLVLGPGWNADPERRQSPHDAIQSRRDWRMSWVTYAESYWDAPVRLAYEGLDQNAEYAVKVTYTGDNLRAQVRLVADGQYPVHGFIGKPSPITPVTFDVPVDATRDGRLVLEWTQPPGAGGAGRGCQIAEVWLIRK